MATDPKRDPLQDEAEAILDANPGSREELGEMVRLLDRGELETVDSAEIDAAITHALDRPIRFD